MLLFNIPDAVKPMINLPKKFADIQTYINNKPCNLNDWHKFVRYTKLIDKHRNLSIKNVFPSGLIMANSKSIYFIRSVGGEFSSTIIDISLAPTSQS